MTQNMNDNKETFYKYINTKCIVTEKHRPAADWSRRPDGKGHGEDQDTNAAFALVFTVKVCFQKSQAPENQ